MEETMNIVNEQIWGTGPAFKYWSIATDGIPKLN